MTAGATRSPLFRLVAGFGLWSFCFVSLYAGHAIGCAFGAAEWRLAAVPVLRVALVTVWLGFCLVQVLLLRRALRLPVEAGDNGRRFRNVIAVGITGAALLATVGTGAPLTVLEPCI